MRKILLCVSAAVMLLTACNKDEDEEPANITPTVANLSGSYKITAATMGGVDVFNNPNPQANLYDPCEKDDILSLQSYSAPATTGTYTITDAGTTCSPTSAASGTWALSNSTTLEIDGNPATINSYNGQKLVVSTNFGGTTWTETYTRQ